MKSLPFLEQPRWPISREPEERVVNPSYDRQLLDHLMDRLLLALEKKDRAQLSDCLVALVHAIQNEEVTE